MKKTPDYVKDTIKRYRNKFDIVQVRLDKGTKDRIKALGLNVNQFINTLVNSELNRMESEKTKDITEKKAQIPDEISEKPVYKFYNEKQYIADDKWWRNIVFFSDDSELDDLFIKFLDSEAEKNDNFKNGCRIAFDLINLARKTSKYTDEELLNMSDEEAEKITSSELEPIDQTEELKKLLRLFVYDDNKQPLLDFIGYIKDTCDIS